MTPYTPEQNVIERFFRSLKEECVWQHSAATPGDVDSMGSLLKSTVMEHSAQGASPDA
jgi:hypothetical protein